MSPALWLFRGIAMRLGLVTYMWGAECGVGSADAPQNCEATGFEGCRTSFDAQTWRRAEPYRRSAGGSPQAVSRYAGEVSRPGSACEYHSPDHGVVKNNIDLTKKFVELSADLGGDGGEGPPQRARQGGAEETTIARIAAALHECGEFAKQHRQEIRVEVHGPGTSKLEVMRKILAQADHSHVVACWNANPGETIDGSIKPGFDLLKDKLGGTIHIHDLYDKAYPYREFFALLKGIGYVGHLCSESPPTADPVRCDALLPRTVRRTGGQPEAVRQRVEIADITRRGLEVGAPCAAN